MARHVVVIGAGVMGADIAAQPCLFDDHLGEISVKFLGHNHRQ